MKKVILTIYYGADNDNVKVRMSASFWNAEIEHQDLYIKHYVFPWGEIGPSKILIQDKLLKEAERIFGVLPSEIQIKYDTWT